MLQLSPDSSKKDIEELKMFVKTKEEGNKL